MNKKLLSILFSSFLVSCSSINQSEINSISNNSVTISSKKQINTLKNVLPTNTSSIRLLSSSLDKSKFAINQNGKKKININPSIQSNSQHIKLLKDAMSLMNKAESYREANNIGRKTAIAIYKNLINNSGTHYDLKNILNESLVFNRVEEQFPDFYDKYSEKNEYTSFMVAFALLVELGVSDGGSPQNMAIYAYNSIIAIQKDNEIPQEIFHRDGFYLASFALNIYASEPEYTKYKDIAKYAIDSLDYDNDNTEALFKKVFKALDIISG